KAEERNVALYDRLLSKVKAYPDLTLVFTNLRRASQENHLPAFKAAVENGGRLDNFKGGGGPGQGRGRGTKSASSLPNAPASAPATVVIDADNFMQSFGSAGAEEQSRVGKAAQAIRVENYPAAVVILQKLLTEGHLTPQQKELVAGTMKELQKSKPTKP
ncbi:MAG: hypothetical protein L0Z50_15320, partial [Verrucomicrobiales bacterium]|nr:hypothetical protein [Verrucomicrobiales bacterium]